MKRMGKGSEVALLAVTLLACRPAGTADAGELDEGVEEIVVTAHKRQENLQDVAASISALGRERLRELGATRVTDLTSTVPGFNFSRASNVDTVFIRGVGGGGRNIGFAGRAGVYLDGVYVGQPGAIDQSLVDVERVEVLRGPQGTMFGRNAVSGAINVVTRAPSRELESEVMATVGNYARYSFSGYVSGPLATDRLLGKLSVHTQQRDGYVHNRFDGNDEIGGLDVTATRGAMHFAVSDALGIDINADYSRDRSLRSTLEANSSTLGSGGFDPFAPESFELVENDLREREDVNYGASMTMRYALAGHELTSISALRRVASTRHSDNDYSPLSLLFTDFDDSFRQLTQELRIASDERGRVRYVAGVFALREEADTNRKATAGRDVVGRFPVQPNAVSANAANIVTESYAVFAHVDYDVVESLTAGIGVRYTHERRRLGFDLDGSRSGAFNIGTLAGFRDRDDEDRLSPELSLIWRFAPDAMLYATYAEAFKSGGWNVDFLSRDQLTPLAGSAATPFAFGTETVESYEIGFKSTWFERRLRLNVAAFVADYADFQTNQFVEVTGGRTVLFLTNAAQAGTGGIELSVEARPIPALRVNLDAAYVDAKFDSFPRGGIAASDASGNQLPFSPRTTGALRTAYSLPWSFAGGGFDVLGQYAYRSRSFSGQENSRDQEMSSYGLYSARVGWTRDDGAFGVTLWGENLSDERYLVNRVRDFIGTQAISFGEPRTYGVEVRAAF